MQDLIPMDGGAVWILAFGLVLKILGFAVRDEILLRVLVAAGLVCAACYYLFRPEPILPSVAANVALVSINVVLILLIILERTTWSMSSEDKRIYAHFPTLSPGHFRRLRKMIRAESADAGAFLTREGEPVNELMLVFSEQITIAKGGRRFPIAGPAFVGEVAFLTGNPSSADVILDHGGTIISMDAAALRKRMQASPPLNNAMIALFGVELARKVADSVPMERAAERSAMDGGGIGLAALPTASQENRG